MQHIKRFVKRIVPYGTGNSIKTINTILISLLIISIFIPFRKVFGGSFANITGIYSDFTSYSLYLSDIVVFLLLFLNLRTLRGFRLRNLEFLLAILIFVLGSTYLVSDHFISLHWYVLLRFVELVIIYLLISRISFSLKPIFILFAVLGAFESVLALFQFFLQHSIGLTLFRESLLRIDIQGVAKIVSHGTTFIRGYGTLPHPNLLSAFLFTSILFSSYLFIRNISSKLKILFLTLSLVSIIGLLITFSRAGILVTLVFGGLLLIGSTVKHYEIRKQIIVYFLILAVALTTWGLIIKPFIFTRVTISDQATVERKFYNHVGTEIVRSFPVTGVGIGTSMLHMQQFSSVKLDSWQIQPIHNYYLLMTAEMGIIIALIFIIFLLWHLKKLGELYWREGNVLHGTLFCIIAGFMFLMLFDHYFYTLVPTQILLWLILGLALREIKKPATI